MHTRRMIQYRLLDGNHANDPDRVARMITVEFGVAQRERIGSDSVGGRENPEHALS